LSKHNASKYIKTVKENYARTFMGRKPTRPPEPPIVEVDGWAAFKHRYGHKDNKLWIPVKVVHVAALGTPKRRGVRRTFWLYWGFDAARFRRSNHSRLFEEQAPPAVVEAITAACAARFTVERLVAVAGEEVVAQERAKLTASTAKRIERTAARLEAAHAAALEENELWDRLYGG
jgi:hypothetical protein